MQERKIRTITGKQNPGGLFVPHTPAPSYHGYHGVEAMSDDKAILFLIIGVGLVIAGAATMK